MLINSPVGEYLIGDSAQLFPTSSIAKFGGVVLLMTSKPLKD